MPTSHPWDPFPPSFTTSRSRKNTSQPPSSFMLPELSRNHSNTSSGELKDPQILDSKQSADVAFTAFPKPLWNRILTGDANQVYETRRAMSSRHITMIGSLKSSSLLIRLFIPTHPSHSYWRYYRHWHLSQCWLGQYLVRLEYSS